MPCRPINKKNEENRGAITHQAARTYSIFGIAVATIILQ